ncbi:acyltransferase [Aliagarivorans marinus]|uniref:acyltransferase n=1 Tax=Aliagarivorans marinus TaxID=561965 RepID=UPI000409A137|nr:acyltransferase family protein [Aliagarivorans marinus]
MSRPANTPLFFIELLRCIAAIAVVGIHVLGPYRHQVGLSDFHYWVFPVGLNAISRWAVPVFMLISGALLLSDARPFNCRHYLTRRLGKVVVPFVTWTLIYAFAASLLGGHWDVNGMLKLIELSPNQPVWYHLWFFYDFIPLYFVIPLLAPLLNKMDEQRVRLLLAAWLCLTLMHWLKVDTPLRQNLILYSGYLVAGWYLFNHDQKDQLNLWKMLLGFSLGSNLLVTLWLDWRMSEYQTVMMSYKTLNTALIACSLFVLAKYYAEQIPQDWRKPIQLISKYSFGIYLCHPLLLIPARELDLGIYQWFAHPVLALLVMIPLLLAIAMLVSALLSRSRFTAWMVP